MVIHILGVGDMPENLSSVAEEELHYFAKNIKNLKREKQREIDRLDTELIGIKEELRKRKDQVLVEQTFQNAFIKD